jgi:hypothetical protein
MFVGGTHMYNPPAINYASYVSLQESTFDGGTFYMSETQATGFARMFWKLMGDRGRTPASTGFRLLCTVPAKSATTIAQLSKGGSYYSRITDEVTAAKSLSNAAGRSYGVIGVTFDQGAEDYSGSTAAATYQASMIQLITDLNTDIKAITGQTQDVYLYVIQDAAHGFRGFVNNPYLARAQLAAAQADSRIKIVYHQGPNIAGVHYEPYQSYISGVNIAYGVVRHYADKNAITVMIPTSVQSDGTTVRVTFPVDSGYLLGFYSFYPSRQAGYGCRIVDSTGTVERTQTTDPVLVNGNSIDITCTAASVVAGDFFDFGDATSYGNIYQFPATGEEPKEPHFGHAIKQPLLTSRTAVSIVGSIPAGTATAPYTMPSFEVSAAPGYTARQPQTIAGSKLVWLVSANEPASITLNGSTVSAMRDFISGQQIVQATAGSQPAYSATGWFDSTPCLTADGIDDFLRGTSTDFGNIPRDNCLREMWFIGDVTVDADTLRHYITYGSSSGSYFSIRDQIVTATHRIRCSTNALHATDTSGVSSGRLWVRAFYDGSNLGVQVNGGTIFTTALANPMNTGNTNVTLFGSTTSGATEYSGKFKEAFIIKGNLSASELTAMHAYCQSLV